MLTTDNNDATNWGLSTLRPHGVAVPLGLPVPNVQFDSFALVFQELVIKGSVVSTKEQAAAMMKTVAKHGKSHSYLCRVTWSLHPPVFPPRGSRTNNGLGIKSHITAIPLEKVPEVLPQAYMDPHLKGRLVVKIG